MGLASASARVRGIEGREGNRSEFAWVEVLVIQMTISHDVGGIFFASGAGRATHDVSNGGGQDPLRAHPKAPVATFCAVHLF